MYLLVFVRTHACGAVKFINDITTRVRCVKRKNNNKGQNKRVSFVKLADMYVFFSALCAWWPQGILQSSKWCSKRVGGCM